MGARTKAGPFDALLGIGPKRCPGSPNATLVISGRRVRGADDVTADESEDRRTEIERFRSREKYQRRLSDPEQLAKRKAWIEANRERVREYDRRFYRSHPERVAEKNRAYARSAYLKDPERFRAKSRAYYQANREKALERAKAYREANRDKLRELRRERIDGRKPRTPEDDQ